MTSACESCRELIGGYVLDALEPDEREHVRRHIESCDACAREHAELATLPALLDVVDSADTAPLHPPAQLEEAVLDRFARETRQSHAAAAREPGAGAETAAPAGTPPASAEPAQRRRSVRRFLLPAAAALACAVAAFGAARLLTGDDASEQRSAAERPRVYDVALSGVGPLPRAAGEARLYPGDTGTGVHLTVRGLEPRAYDYELWCIRDDGWKVSAGTFRADSSGRADINLTTAAKPSEYDSLSIQARPAGRGSDARGPRVLIGRLRS
jgi:anti-sigma-K factor RskA